MSGVFLDNMVGALAGISVAGVGLPAPRFAPLLSGDVVMPFSITASTFMVDLLQNGSTATMSVAFTSTLFVGIYSSTSDSLSLLNSATATWGFAANATNNSTGFAGTRYVTLGTGAWSSSPVFVQGSQYYVGIFFASSGIANQTISLMGLAQYYTTDSQRSGSVGAAAATASTVGPIPFLGRYSTTTGAIPTAIANSEIRKTSLSDCIMPHIVLNSRPTLSAY